jgi:predicted CXXCH cytochrome family protein
MSPRKNRASLLLMVAVGVSCGVVVFGCSRQTRYEVLTFFFTGVPPMEEPGETSGTPIPPGESDEIMVAEATQAESSAEMRKHAPYEEGNCNACHDPGGGNTLFNEPNKLCFRCHEDFVQAFSWIHGPVAVGFCNTCHEPHESRNEYLLISTSAEICFNCHASQDIYRSSYHRDTSGQSCVVCHNPHGGDNRWLLKGSDRPLQPGSPGIPEIPHDSGFEPGQAAGYETSQRGLLASGR